MIFATYLGVNHITEMKNLVLFLCLFLLTSSCEKNQTVPDDEVPGWLKTRIAQDELTIASNPQSGLDIAAWIRYKYQKEYYFEYHNMLYSSLPPVYNYAGESVNFLSDPYINYQDKKCCKQYVWKGSAYYLE
jgi:hypothetical protein